ncbi:MAG: methionine--tRNA ligase [Patescibacteria group bacterium]
MPHQNSQFYITTPIYYVNDKPHLGHTYTTVAADVLARYHSMTGKKVFFATGTDEHGAKIEQKATENNENVEEFVDRIAADFQFAWDELEISYNFLGGFIRTTDPKHMRAVQKTLQYLYDKGDIYIGVHEGWYCRGCEQYKTEGDLIEGKRCPDHNTEAEWMSEETYMFRMSAYSEQLLAKIKNDELKIRPEEKKNEIISFYKNHGLHDISFSRKNVKWGVPLPFDNSHTAYVWADAFLNYLTVLGWDGDPDNKPEMWPPQLQLMSKDILRVHATIWPAMLLALGLPLPKQMFVHGFFLVDGQKMSKSIGNVVAPADLINRYGADGARYLLMSATPFGHDGDINWERFDEKYNADLANGLGNLLNRVVSLTVKYLDGIVPEIEPEEGEKLKIKGVEGLDKSFSQDINDIWSEYRQSFEEIHLDEVLRHLNKLLSHCDKHINAVKLWELVKEDKQEAAKHLYCLAETLRQIGWMIIPFMPGSTSFLWEYLGLKPTKEIERSLEDAKRWGGLKGGEQVVKGAPLFPRIN